MFKNIIIAISILFGLLISNNLLACNDLDGISLYGDSNKLVLIQNYKYNGLASKNKNSFNDLFIKNGVNLNFENCKNSLKVIVIKEVKSGRIYKALVTNEDSCDGGNTEGVLLDQFWSIVLGSIHDTEIYCF